MICQGSGDSSDWSLPETRDLYEFPHQLYLKVNISCYPNFSLTKQFTMVKLLNKCLNQYRSFVVGYLSTQSTQSNILIKLTDHCDFVFPDQLKRYS